MEAYAKPMRELADALSWFVRARELRLLYVACDGELRTTAIRVAMSNELHADNRSPFVFLEDPFSPSNEGWLERVARMRAQHAVRKERMAEEGEPLPELPAHPSLDDPFAAFGAQLAQLLEARADWHEGLLVVLAPLRVEKAQVFCERLNVLLDARRLGAVRWIVIDPEPPALEALAGRLGDRAMRVDARVNEADAQRELAQMLDAAEAAPPDAVGPARVGAAWPRGVSPPPRRDRPSAHPDEIEALLEKEGIRLPLAGKRGTELSRALLRGSQAMRRGDAKTAVEQQARARDLCIEAGLPRETTVMQLVLGAYLVAATETRLAAKTYGDASAFGEQNGHKDLAAQAELALGALHLREGRGDEAYVAYLRAATLAKDAGMHLVAIESLRLAGQLRVDAGHEEKAMELWGKAVEIAESIAPAEARASSAAEAARGIAMICHKRGLGEQARRFEEKSRALEGDASGRRSEGSEGGAMQTGMGG